MAEPACPGPITGFHAHVYFDETTAPQAEALCQRAGAELGVAVGRFHRRPVGPHPGWSCQLAFNPEQFGQVVPWLALHRAGLVVLVHPLTGDDLADHTAHALWMGGMPELVLSALV